MNKKTKATFLAIFRLFQLVTLPIWIAIACFQEIVRQEREAMGK